MPASPGANGSSFEAILFDVGGVMLTNGWDHKERAVLMQNFGLDREAFESRHEKPNDDWERDIITIGGYLKETIFYEPRSFTEDAFIEAMKAVSLPIPATAIPVVRDLAESGEYLIGTLNNESRYLHEYRMRKYGIDRYLDVQFCSAFLGMRKPDADIYRRALDILSLPGERVVFIDDRANNTAAAAAAGMHAIQFQSEDKLRSDLAYLGIL